MINSLQREVEKLESLMSIKEIEFIVQNCLTKEILGTKSFAGKVSLKKSISFTQIHKKNQGLKTF